MPEIVIHLAEGREPDKKRALMKDITDAVVRHFGVDPEAVVVQIVESKKSDKMKGGLLFTERASKVSAPKS
jgi:4-oxalocrotonate tautomerase